MEKKREGASPRQKMDNAVPHGFIFGCTNATEAECLELNLFGLTPNKLSEVQKVPPGVALFLLNCDERVLTGVFAARCGGAENVNPHAWGGKFPAQVRVVPPTFRGRIPEGKFQPMLKGNYRRGNEFIYRLEKEQVNYLCDLFDQSVPQVGHSRPRRYVLPYNRAFIMKRTVARPNVGGKIFGGLQGVTIARDSVQSPPLERGKQKVLLGGGNARRLVQSNGLQSGSVLEKNDCNVTAAQGMEGTSAPHSAGFTPAQSSPHQFTANISNAHDADQTPDRGQPVTGGAHPVPSSGDDGALASNDGGAWADNDDGAWADNDGGAWGANDGVWGGHDGAANDNGWAGDDGAWAGNDGGAWADNDGGAWGANDGASVASDGVWGAYGGAANDNAWADNNSGAWGANDGASVASDGVWGACDGAANDNAWAGEDGAWAGNDDGAWAGDDDQHGKMNCPVRIGLDGCVISKGGSTSMNMSDFSVTPPQGMKATSAPTPAGFAPAQSCPHQFLHNVNNVHNADQTSNKGGTVTGGAHPVPDGSDNGAWADSGDGAQATSGDRAQAASGDGAQAASGNGARADSGDGAWADNGDGARADSGDGARADSGDGAWADSGDGAWADSGDGAWADSDNGAWEDSGNGIWSPNNKMKTPVRFGEDKRMKNPVRFESDDCVTSEGSGTMMDSQSGGIGAGPSHLPVPGQPQEPTTPTHQPPVADAANFCQHDVQLGQGGSPSTLPRRPKGKLDWIPLTFSLGAPFGDTVFQGNAQLYQAGVGGGVEEPMVTTSAGVGLDVGVPAGQENNDIAPRSPSQSSCDPRLGFQNWKSVVPPQFGADELGGTSSMSRLLGQSQHLVGFGAQTQKGVTFGDQSPMEGVEFEVEPQQNAGFGTHPQQENSKFSGPLQLQQGSATFGGDVLKGVSMEKEPPGGLPSATPALGVPMEASQLNKEGRIVNEGGTKPKGAQYDLGRPKRSGTKRSATDVFETDEPYEYIKGLPIVTAAHIMKRGIGNHNKLYSERGAGGIVCVPGMGIPRKKDLPQKKKAKVELSERSQHFIKVAQGFYSGGNTPEEKFKNMIHGRVSLSWRSSCAKAWDTMKNLRKLAITTNRLHLFNEVLEESGYVRCHGIIPVQEGKVPLF